MASTACIDYLQASWRIDDMTGAEMFSGHSREYAEFRPRYPAAVVDYLAEVAPRAEVAWEAGCGSGQFSVPLAARFDRVIATDASAEQIRHAVRYPKVEYRLAPAEASGLPDAVADLAVAAQAAHWFKLDGYYAEVRRVTKSDAVIALITYGSTIVDEAIDRIVQRYYAETVAPYWAPERRHVEAGYMSLPFPFEPIEAPTFEMDVEWTREQLLGYIDTWSASRALQHAEGPARIAAFRRELAEAWDAGPPIRAVRWRLRLRVGRVHAT